MCRILPNLSYFSVLVTLRLQERAHGMKTYSNWHIILKTYSNWHITPKRYSNWHITLKTYINWHITMKTYNNWQSVFLFFKWGSQLSCCMNCDPPASSAVLVIATHFSCFIDNKLAGFCRCWGFIFVADIYEFLEPNRHFALNMSYVLQCVYGPHRCEMRRWLLLDSIQSRRLPQSLRIVSGCTAVCAPELSLL